VTGDTHKQRLVLNDLDWALVGDGPGLGDEGLNTCNVRLDLDVFAAFALASVSQFSGGELRK
jgi:hypothetical protein